LLQIDKCIFYNNSTTTVTSNYIVDISVANVNAIVRNCIIYGNKHRGINGNNATSVEISNCTVYGFAGASDGIVVNANATVKDVFCGGFTAECFDTSGTAPAGSNNASTDSTADIDYTASLVDLVAADQFVSLTGGSEDFHLKAGTSLNAAGTPLGAVPTDIVGTTRDGSTPDIGAFEFIALTGTVSATLNAVTAALTGTETFSGDVAANLNAVTAALTGETIGGNLVANLNAVTADLSGTVEEAAGNTGDIASTLSAVTAELAGAETFTGTVESSLSAVTAELAGTETITGTVAGTLEALTSELAGDVVSPVEGTVAGTLAALTGLLEGETDAEAIDSWGPVLSRGAYKRLAKRRKKKREDLEALAHELRVLLGLVPEPVTGEPIPTAREWVAPAFLVGIEDDPLRVQVARMLQAVKEIEAKAAAALDDDDEAILAMMEAA
jgi:hypothetical protein